MEFLHFKIDLFPYSLHIVNCLLFITGISHPTKATCYLTFTQLEAGTLKEVCSWLVLAYKVGDIQVRELIASLKPYFVFSPRERPVCLISP